MLTTQGPWLIYDTDIVQTTASSYLTAGKTKLGKTSMYLSMQWLFNYITYIGNIYSTYRQLDDSNLTKQISRKDIIINGKQE